MFQRILRGVIAFFGIPGGLFIVFLFFHFIDSVDKKIAKQKNEKNIQNYSFVERHPKGVVLSVFVLGIILIVSSYFAFGLQTKDHSGADSTLSDRAAIGADSYASGYEAGKADGYDLGYAAGYEVAEGEQYVRTTPGGSTGNTGTGSPRQDAIAEGYIGNKNSGLYHRSTCSYLPDQVNQIVFRTKAEAEAAGFSPCSHCDP